MERTQNIHSTDSLPIINVQDKETQITLQNVQELFKSYFYNDEYEKCEALLQHFEEVLPLGKVTDSNGEVLGTDSDEVKAFLASEEVKCVKEDRELFNYFFEELHVAKDWTSYYNEPTRKIKYKYEPGMSGLVSVKAKTIINAPLVHVLSHFTEIDLVKTWFPQVTECKQIKEISGYRGLYLCQANMVWPVWPREMIFTGTGMYDRENKAVLLVVKSPSDDSCYFDMNVPETTEGYVRIDIKRGFHHFKQIDANTTKYTSIYNVDPKLTYMPNWFLNFVTTKICYTLLNQLQERSLKVAENAYGERIKERHGFYSKIQSFLDVEVSSQNVGDQVDGQERKDQEQD
eukprot:403347117